MKSSLNPLGECFMCLLDGESTLACCHSFSNEQMCKCQADPLHQAVGVVAIGGDSLELMRGKHEGRLRQIL